MDGTFAVLFLLAGLTDMGMNHCGNGCLAQAETQSRMTLSFGNVMFQEKTIAKEAYLRYDFGKTYGPFQTALGVSVTDQGSTWIGFGATYTKHFANDRAYAQLHLMPGIYSKGSGPNLGYPIEFRSGAELGYEARNGVRYGISYDHRSNADIKKTNPGLETIQLRVSFPLK